MSCAIQPAEKGNISRFAINETSAAFFLWSELSWILDLPCARRMEERMRVKHEEQQLTFRYNFTTLKFSFIALGIFSAVKVSSLKPFSLRPTLYAVLNMLD